MLMLGLGICAIDMDMEAGELYIGKLTQTKRNKLSVGESNPAFARDRRVY